MALNQAPGVKVRESAFKSFDSGTSTTTTGFVGTSQFGPTELTRLTSVTQLHAIFGYPGSNDYAIYALENLLVYADEAYFKRVVNEEDTVNPASGNASVGVTVTSKQLGSYFNKAVVNLGLDFAGLAKYSLECEGQVLESMGQIELEDLADIVTAESSFIELEVSADSTALESALKTGVKINLTGGTDVNSVTTQDIIDGLQIYNNVEVVDIALLAAPGQTDLSVISAGTTIAESRGDCIYIADCPNVPYATLVSDTNNGIKELNSDFCAVFYPWVSGSDSVTGLSKQYPPSVYYCAQTALSEFNYNPWYAVAGLKRGLIAGATGVSQETNKSQRDTLYGTWNINPIVMSQGQGVVIWGNLTTKKNNDDVVVSVLGNISTRKAINYVKKQLQQKSQAVLFDPNDSLSRESFKLAIEPVLRQVQAERGFSEYYVDFSQTSVEDLNSGILRASVYVKPVKAIEYVIISINATPEGVDFVEEE